MGFIGDAISSVTAPILGKPDASMQDQAQQAGLNASNSQTALANLLMSQTAPLRQSIINRSTDFMNGNFDPTASALYAPMKASTEQQFSTARNNIMSSLPAGGALFEGLADLEGKKAQSLSSLIAQIVADEYQKAYGLGTGTPQIAGSLFQGGGGNAIGLNQGLTGQQVAGTSLLNNLINTGGQVYNTNTLSDSALLRALIG